MQNAHPSDIAAAPCGHPYCRRCLVRLFRARVNDSTAMAPRCCALEIPSEHVRPWLNAASQTADAKQHVKLDTEDHIHCHMPACLALLRPSNSSDRYAYSGRCWSITCTDCKGPAHVSPLCPGGESSNAALLHATNVKLQLCYGCRRLLELKSDAYHMMYVPRLLER